MKISILLEDLLLELSPEQVYKTYYSGMTRGLFMSLVSMDPQTVIDTENGKFDLVRLGKFSKLIIKLFKAGEIKNEDRDKIKEYLTYVYKYHVPIDMNKVQSVSDIYNSVKKYMVIDTQDFKEVIKSLSRGRDYQVLLDGQQWLILQPLTEKGSCYLGIGTEWCTTYGPYSTNKEYQERGNYFSQYTKQGPLYIIIDKGYAPNKYQFHFETNQYMSSADERIDTAGFLEKNPEIKNFFFPSFVREVTEEESKLEMNRIGILSQEDAIELIKNFSEKQGIQNILALSILNKDREKVAQLIQDDILNEEVYIKDKSLVFSFDKLPEAISEVSNNLNQLNHDKDDAWDHVYRDQQEGRDDDKQWQDTLEPIFKEYFDKNTNMVRYDLGSFNYEDFKTDFFQGFYENDGIQDAYLESLTKKSYGNFESRVDEEISDIEKYMIISWRNPNEVKVSIANFIQFIIKNEIVIIKNNLEEVMEDYINDSRIGNFEYDYYYDYEVIYPTYQDIENSVDEHFSEMIDDLEGTRQCVETRKKFNDIYAKFFNNNPTYENAHVYIHIVDLKVNCDNGSVNIIYKNKDKNKTYNGYVKVENLPVYITNYELFESFMNFRKNVIGEQSELKELFGVSFDARIWEPIIRSRLNLAKTYIKNKKPIPDLTIQGREYPQQYKTFPIDEIRMSVDPKYGNGAGYDEVKSGRDINGKYVTYFIFGPLANNSTINHELRHAFEDFKAASNRGALMRQNKEATKLFSGDFDKFMTAGDPDYIYPPFGNIFMGLYLTSKIERSAFAETVYDNDPMPIIKIIQEVIANNDISTLLKYSPKRLEANWQKFKTDYKIPVTEKFRNYEDFLKWAADEIKYKGEKTLKKLLKVKFYREQNKQNKQKGAV